MTLSFDKPKKLEPAVEHNRNYSSDSGVDGTYVPNMSTEDKFKWKAKKIGGEDPRIEIRKTVSGRWHNRGTYAQVLLIVRPEGSVIMSANGKMAFAPEVWAELTQAVQEAIAVLKKS